MVIDKCQREYIEAVSWCMNRFSLDAPATSLRSKVLMPDLELSNYDDETGLYQRRTVDELEMVVSELVKRRRQLMLEQNILQPSFDEIKSTWRVLVYEYDNTDFSGMSEDESEGFFDVYDAPPWDSLFYFENLVNEGSCLYYCVPSEYSKEIDLSLYVNPTECLKLISVQ